MAHCPCGQSKGGATSPVEISTATTRSARRWETRWSALALYKAAQTKPRRVGWHSRPRSRSEPHGARALVPHACSEASQGPTAEGAWVGGRERACTRSNGDTAHTAASPYSHPCLRPRMCGLNTRLGKREGVWQAEAKRSAPSACLTAELV